jgi:hypothetical protein
MMAQYLALKAEATDSLLFYRMGDFFELFFEDARIAAGCLDIALTARGEHEGAPIPMCGVPIHAAEAYLARLIRAGHRVAIAEQTESPAEAKKRGSKSVVSRAIVRVVTAGTLTEEALLDTRAANWLVATAKVGERCGVAAADVSTGRLELFSVAPAALEAELARLDAAEIVSPDPFPSRPVQKRTSGFDSLAAERRLCARFGVATLDGFGQFDRAALAAAGGLLTYLDEVARESLPFLRPPSSRRPSDHMAIDAATRESLELTVSAGGTRAGSLLATVDRTVTGAGARLLGADLGAPLLDRPALEARLDLVAAFERDGNGRHQLRKQLKALPDIGRALGRLAAGRGSPRDLGQLRDGLIEASGSTPALPPCRPPGFARCLAARADRPRRAHRPPLPRAGALPADRRGGRRLYCRGLRPGTRRTAPDRRRRSAGDRGAGSALSPADRGAHAQDPPQQCARLPHRSARAQCGQADGGGLGLHPSPDDGGRGALQRARSARAGAAGRPGRKPRARGGSSASRGTDGRRPPACAAER